MVTCWWRKHMLRILELYRKSMLTRCLKMPVHKRRFPRNIHGMSLIWHSWLKPLARFLSTCFPAQEDWAERTGLGSLPFTPTASIHKAQNFPSGSYEVHCLALSETLANLQQTWLITLPLLSKTCLFGPGRLIYKSMYYKFEPLSFKSPQHTFDKGILWLRCTLRHVSQGLKLFNIPICSTTAKPCVFTAQKLSVSD